MPQLSSIAEIRMGATLRGRDATRPDPNGSYRFIRIGDISQDGTFLTEEFVRIEPNERFNEELCLRPGDVLFPNRGTRTTAVAYFLDQPQTIVGSQFFIVRLKRPEVDSEYLAWFLRSEESAKHFDTHREGSYVKIIQRRDLADLDIPLPSLEAQRRIIETAELARQERELSNQLTNLRWQYAGEQLIRAARNPSQCKSSPK